MELELPQDDLVSSERPTAEELLEAARFLDHSRLVALLDASTTDIDVRNTGGLTALQLAVHQGSVTAVEALLDHGADIEAHDTLLMAVQNGAVDIVACLLRRGASVGTSYSGTDPLHEAVRRGNLEIVQLLLDYGADVRAASSDKRQPLFLAVWKRSPAIIKLLLARGADPDWFFSEEPPTSLHLATQNDDLESIQALLDGGASVDPRDFNGATPLFRAVAHGNLETTRLLLQRGANLRIWRADGSSPLDVAEGNQEMLELLQGETVLQGPRLRAGDGTIDDQIGQPYTVLRPRLPPPETDRDKIVACQGFEATIVDFFTGGEHEQVIHKTPSVYELLYSHGPEACRSKMGGNDPDFTWYHLPSNNMVWAEALVRRIAAEKGGLSLEMYDEARKDLDLTRLQTGNKPTMSSKRLPTVRSHSQGVKGLRSFSGDGDGDSIVSFVPFLHFETYDGYVAMTKAMEDARNARKTRNRQPPGPALDAPDRDAESGGKRRPTEGWRPSTRSYSSVGTTTGSDDSSVELKKSIFMSVQTAFQSLIAKWNRVLDRRALADGSRSDPTDSDLERQGSRGDNASHKTEDADATVPTDERPPSHVPQEINSIAPEDMSLPPSRPTTVSGPSNAASKRDRVSVKSREDGMEIDAHHDRVSETDVNVFGRLGSKKSSNFDEKPPSSGRAPTIPPPKQAEQKREMLPTGNLNEHLIKGYYSPGSLSYQPRRTLDQYGYADVETTSHRDDDQVVYRYTKKDTHTKTKIFMVDQLWLWVIGTDTIITCCPLRWDSWTSRRVKKRTPVVEMPRPALLTWLGGQSAPHGKPPGKQHRQRPAMYVLGQPPTKKKPKTERSRPLADPFSFGGGWPEQHSADPLNVCQLVTGYLSKQGRDAVSSAHDLASIITTCCVDVFDPRRTPDEFLFFEFFERSIGAANDQVANYLRQFKDAISEMRDGQREDVVMNITAETGLMIEVEDILDELHTLKMVLKDQQAVIHDMNRTLKQSTPDGQKPPQVNTRTLENHLLRIERMEGAANKADTSLHRLMDLKQKQASLAEAYYARQSARDTARQGKTVIVFTVVTILFLPVSFIAAVFSINTNGYPLDSNERIPFDYVMKCILTIGLALSVPLIIIAFNVDRIAELLYKLRGFNELLWHRGTIVATVMGIAAAILTPIWTSDLATNAQVATTVVLLLLVAITVITYLISRLVSMTRRSMTVSSITSSAGSSVISI